MPLRSRASGTVERFRNAPAFIVSIFCSRRLFRVLGHVLIVWISQASLKAQNLGGNLRKRTSHTRTSNSQDRTVLALRLGSKCAEADLYQPPVGGETLYFAPSRIRRGQKAVVLLFAFAFRWRLWKKREAMYRLLLGGSLTFIV